MKNLKKYLYLHKSWLIAAAVAVCFELLLRFVFGFGNVPVYYSSPSYEYALQPSQEINRFGNKYQINSNGMRSENLRSGELRILKFGDSVLNGGITTDQNELASSILEYKLDPLIADRGVRVLNISAGSWGPDNAFAWMNEHGNFDAVGLVLLFSSHDWQDQMTFDNVVGTIPFYPAEKHTFAITDAAHWIYSRYFQKIAWNDLPKIENSTAEKHDFNPGWERFISYSRSEMIPLIVYHHANREEILRNEWTQDGKALQLFLKENKVSVVSGLESGFDAADFRDMIHPTPSGQEKIAKALEPELRELIQYAR